MSPVYQIFNMITAKEDRAVPFPYPKRAIAGLPKSARERSYPVGNRPFAQNLLKISNQLTAYSVNFLVKGDLKASRISVFGTPNSTNS